MREVVGLHLEAALTAEFRYRYVPGLRHKVWSTFSAVAKA